MFHDRPYKTIPAKRWTYHYETSIESLKVHPFSISTGSPKILEFLMQQGDDFRLLKKLFRRASTTSQS